MDEGIFIIIQNATIMSWIFSLANRAGKLKSFIYNLCSTIGPDYGTSLFKKIGKKEDIVKIFTQTNGAG